MRILARLTVKKFVNYQIIVSTGAKIWYNNDGSIKKRDLDNLISDEEDKNENYTYKNVTFVHEEKYLQELKQLIKLLD